MATEMPENAMLVRTSPESDTVEVYGAGGHGVSVPLHEVDRFISQLEADCTNPQVLYRIACGGKRGQTFNVPGCKVQEMSRYLREARDAGWDFRGYRKFF